MNVFKQLFISIYSPKAISTFRFQGIGKSILFVFILSLLSTIPSWFHLTNELKEASKGVNQTLTEDFPSFSIEDGKLITDTNHPVEINRNEFTFILDGTGTYGVEEIEEKNNAIGILEDQFVFVTNGQAQAYEYSLLNISLTKEDLVDLSKQFNQLLPIIMTVLIILMFLFSAFVKFIEVTILALFGKAINNSLQRNLNFSKIWIISAYASTLATFFFFIMDLLQVIVPGGFLLNWFVHIFVLYLTLKEIPQTKNPLKVS
ncbi:DUF1189 domain-containing protein [Metabacillus sediminilitoris]|uniref:DUF1189 domain-containing protein n=1 Tax=Metabacillus sediminilitoris TaxID=2567941 RepID=A0A4S4BZB9_9BACI|nr:DUF1189 domain-containing protein [Metabacillus sediminilitoris]QGQ47283.1 DUF1189 domain-containing protein [Metabacillus sediminilitoris]THF80625.1 DUF1189 domain-containing protein [Metabacillus sediminilitoris]